MFNYTISFTLVYQQFLRKQRYEQCNDKYKYFTIINKPNFKILHSIHFVKPHKTFKRKKKKQKGYSQITLIPDLLNMIFLMKCPYVRMTYSC